MNDLPYKDLFPIIHPLKEPEHDILEQLPQFLRNKLRNHYEFYVRNDYINEHKLDKAVKQLEKFGVLNNGNIDVLMNEFDVSNLALGRHIDVNDKDYAVFWVFDAAAFLLLNRLLASWDGGLEADVISCFDNAYDYKREWENRAVRRNGAAIRKRKIEEDKENMYVAWSNLPENVKKTPKLAVEDYLKPEDNAQIVKKSTVLTWCRKWKKEYFIS